MLGRAAARSPARALRARRPAALRTGQMVSRRAAAALGAELLLAQGRRADVARSRSCSRVPDTTTTSGRTMRSASAETLARRLGLDPEYVNAGVRRSGPLPAARAQAADQRRSVSTISSKIRASANASARVFERGLEDADRLRAAAPARRSAKTGPNGRPGLWMLRGQHLYLDARRFALGLRLPLPSLPWVAPTEAPQIIPGRSDGRSRPLCRCRRRRRPSSRHRRLERDRSRDRKPEARRVGAMGRAHRVVRRAARRPPARLHAAGRGRRGLPRSARGDRGHRRASGDAGRDRGLHAARRSSHAAISGHARSRA